MKTVDISGMDPELKRYGYEWGCQIIMFRALRWLREHPGSYPRIKSFRSIVGVTVPNNQAAREMEDYALNHDKLREFGATGAMVQFAISHAMRRNVDEKSYFASLDAAGRRVFDFDERDAFPEEQNGA